MILYHGSNVEIGKIDLGKSRPNKDFWHGTCHRKTPQTMNVTPREFEYMKEHITKCLISMLMDREQLSLRDAFDVVYNSSTFSKLSDPETGLYFQSPGYVYSYLENERRAV